ncbi:MAG: hypothetical protein QNL33_18840 [Akkermansiaceae bacterium]
MLHLAEKWEVPQPKPGSKLIKIWAYYNSTGEFYNLGFVEPDDPTHALLGMRMELISNLRPPEEAPREILLSFFQVFDRYA